MAKAKIIRGSQAFIQGRELECYLDVDKSIGAAFERCLHCFKDTHTHDRLLFVFPRGATIFEVVMAGKTYQVHSNEFIVLPGRIPHSDRGVSTIYDVMALFPDDPTVHAICDDYKIPRDLPFKGSIVKATSPWLKESIEKYFYDKFLSRTAHPTDVSLLETQILRESFRAAFLDVSSSEKKSKTENSGLKRSLEFLEANLFEKIDLDTLSSIACMSKTRFIRMFKDEFKVTPIEYLRNRRLDEALHLLKQGKYTVSEVALLTGYSEHAAFHHAFRSHFGKSPSHYIKSK